MIRLVERRKPRSYYFADIYALDYRNKDKDIQERVKLVGKYLVSPTSMNDSYIELSTSKRMGSIDRNKLESMDLRNGFDYPNLFVDINSLVKATKEEIVTYVKSQDSTQNELNFIRNTVLNGCLPHNKFFYKASIKHLKEGYEKEFKKLKGERNLDDYSVDLGSYLFTDINDMPFVEVITGTPFSCYFTKESHNQIGVPFLKLVMDICVKGHDTLLVDEDHQIKLFGNDIYEEFNRQNSIGFEELSNRFASLEKEYKPEGDSSDVKGGLTKKPGTKKGKKE